jgi:primase-polymerase (primpol)-like protein
MPLKPWYKVVTPREDLENSFGTVSYIHFEKQIDANQLFKNSASSIKKLAHSNADFGLRIAEFKTKNSLAQSVWGRAHSAKRRASFAKRVKKFSLIGFLFLSLYLF